MTITKSRVCNILDMQALHVARFLQLTKAILNAHIVKYIYAKT